MMSSPHVSFFVCKPQSHSHRCLSSMPSLLCTTACVCHLQVDIRRQVDAEVDMAGPPSDSAGNGAGDGGQCSHEVLPKAVFFSAITLPPMAAVSSGGQGPAKGSSKKRDRDVAQTWPQPVYTFQSAKGWTVSDHFSEFTTHIEPLESKEKGNGEWRCAKRVGPAQADMLKKQFDHRSKVWKEVQSRVAVQVASDPTAPPDSLVARVVVALQNEIDTSNLTISKWINAQRQAKSKNK